MRVITDFYPMVKTNTRKDYKLNQYKIFNEQIRNKAAEVEIPQIKDQMEELQRDAHDKSNKTKAYQAQRILWEMQSK